METGTCQSCGTDGCDNLVTLQRLYVTPGPEGAEPTVVRVDDIERWCAACRTHYPHQRLTEDEPPPTR